MKDRGSGQPVYIHPSAVICGKVKMGSGSSVWPCAVVRGDCGPIILGEGVNIQDCAVIHSERGKKVRIGDNVTVGHGAVVHASDVGECSLIGMGAVVMGSRVGRHCVVAAGSLLVEGSIIPDGTLAMGTPARVVRKLDRAEIRDILSISEKYRVLALEYGKHGKMR